MKAFWKSIIAISCTLVMAISFTACDFGSKKALSAYEIAVENGFVGTEQEWLDSLQGSAGEKGDNLNIQEVYEEAKKNGYTGSILEFMKEYLSVEVDQNNNTEIIAHNALSVVSVLARFEIIKETGNIFGIPTTEKYVGTSAGSGVIFSLDKAKGNAYIVTNYHVVYNAESTSKISDCIYLYLYGGLNKFDPKTGTDSGTGIKAEYVGGAMQYDIAVLKVTSNEILRKSSAEVATVGESESLKIGEKVFAVGNPKNLGISVTEGIVSVETEYIAIKMEDEPIGFRVIRIDAAINSGNSGGALFDSEGKLIGITNAKLNGPIGDSIDNIAYALPISQVKEVVDNILANNGELNRALIGIEQGLLITDSKAVYDSKLNKAVIYEEVVLGNISRNSLASGSLRSGDILRSVQINDNAPLTITRRHHFYDIMLEVRKGDTVKITVERDGENKVFPFVFDKDEYFSVVR